MVFKVKAGFARSLQRGSCWLQILLLAAALGLQGCSSVITSVSFIKTSLRPNPFCDSRDSIERARCTPELLESLRFVEIGKEMHLSLEGKGMCAGASVDFGDGKSETYGKMNLDEPPAKARRTISWIYFTWPGKKLIHVKGENGCLGDVTKEITVGIGPNGREDFRLGFAPNNSVCNVVTGVLLHANPNFPDLPVRKGTGVRIQTDSRKINYGQANISFDASGDPSSPIPPNYPFQNHRKFSLVYRIGSQLIQGEAGPVTFIADQTAPLEVCVNDNPSYLTDNSGGMLITITVNERSAQ